MHLVNYFVPLICRVLGQVSCELVAPKLNRATEGILFFNLELSQMAAPAFEPGRYLNLFLKLLQPQKNLTAVSCCLMAWCYFMTSTHYCFHRQSDLLVKLNRLLERCLRNSKCIDTESLCVVAGEKVENIPCILNFRITIVDSLVPKFMLSFSNLQFAFVLFLYH